MERAGVKVDRAELESLSSDFAARLADLAETLGVGEGVLREAKSRIDDHLRRRRSTRLRPDRDDKVVTAWNGIAESGSLGAGATGAAGPRVAQGGLSEGGHCGAGRPGRRRASEVRPTRRRSPGHC